MDQPQRREDTGVDLSLLLGLEILCQNSGLETKHI
jgi:hypothetical protein